MKKILKWLDNYWYHYKWPTIVITLLVITVAIMLVQYFDRDQYDVSVIYAGPFEPTAVQTQNIESDLSKIVSEDTNNDGKKNLQINNFLLLTDEQINEKTKEATENGSYFAANRTELANTQQQFTNQVMAGEASICFLDPYWYELLKEQNAFVKLDELVDTVPDGAYDEYAVYLKDTSFAEYFSTMASFPEDTLVCFRALSTTTAFKGKKDAEEKYSFSRECFINLLTFKVKGADE